MIYLQIGSGKFNISNKLNGSRNEFGLWKSVKWWPEQYRDTNIKAHTAKTYKQFWHTKYRDYFNSQKVFKCLVILNPWFAILGGYRLVSGTIGVKIGRPIINQS